MNMQSQERARKLRADLAVEEHRGQELDRILKEVLPYPKTPNVQKPRPARKVTYFNLFCSLMHFFLLAVWSA